MNLAAGVEGPVRSLDGTAYLTIADTDRSVVSSISSLFRGFGSGSVVPGTGLLPQDRGALSSLDPKHRNRFGGRN